MSSTTRQSQKQIIRGYKFKLELTATQEKICSQWGGACRLLYNLGLAQREMNYKFSHRKSTTYNQQAKELKTLKDEFPFFAEVPYGCLQQTLIDLDKVYQGFFKGLGGYPKFKSKSRSQYSFRFPDPKQFEVVQTKKVCSRKNKNTSKGFGIVDLPKIGKLKFRQSRLIQGEVRNVTIRRESNGWHVSFCVKENIAVVPAYRSAIGIDRGINSMGMTSGAQILEVPNDKFKKIEVRISKLQRINRNKIKFSKNWRKAQNKVRNLHSKLARIRHDTIHKLTSDIAKNHSFVAIEDLKIKNMTATAKGTIDEPGSRVAQKSGLNRSILRQGWGMLGMQLEYKMGWRNSTLIKVSPAYTSQTCSQCGHVEAENRKNEAFRCVSCGHSDHADINAAKNILKVGMDIFRTSPSGGKPVKRRLSLRSRNPKARKGASPA